MKNIMSENKTPKNMVSPSNRVKIVAEMTEKTVDDFDVFPVSYVERVTAENALLVRTVDTFLQNPEINQSIIDKLLECLGTEMFHKLPNGKYLWKGIR